MEIIETKIRPVDKKTYGPPITHVQESYAMVTNELGFKHKSIVSTERLTSLEASRRLLKKLLEQKINYDTKFLSELKRIRKVIATVEK